MTYDTYLVQEEVSKGIYGIKDTYVVSKYVKKTLLEMGFIWVWVLDTYLVQEEVGQGAVLQTVPVGVQVVG
jgi:hypothetical protein